MSDEPATAARLRRNAESRAWATRDRMPWDPDEDEFLVEFWIDVDPQVRDEVTISQSLERTIEACRVRCEHIRQQRGWVQKVKVRVEVTRGWLVGHCHSCGRLGDVYSDGTVAKCEDCR